VQLHRDQQADDIALVLIHDLPLDHGRHGGKLSLDGERLLVVLGLARLHGARHAAGRARVTVGQRERHEDGDTGDLAVHAGGGRASRLLRRELDVQRDVLTADEDTLGSGATWSDVHGLDGGALAAAVLVVDADALLVDACVVLVVDACIVLVVDADALLVDAAVVLVVVVSARFGREEVVQAVEVASSAVLAGRVVPFAAAVVDTLVRDSGVMVDTVHVPGVVRVGHAVAVRVDGDFLGVGFSVGTVAVMVAVVMGFLVSLKTRAEERVSGDIGEILEPSVVVQDGTKYASKANHQKSNDELHA